MLFWFYFGSHPNIIKKELKEKNKISENPIRDAFVHHWRLVGLVVLCTALFAVSSWTTTGYSTLLF